MTGGMLMYFQVVNLIWLKFIVMHIWSTAQNITIGLDRMIDSFVI